MKTAIQAGGHHDSMTKENAMDKCSKNIVDVSCAEDAKCHAKKIRGQMEELIDHLRADSEKVSDLQAKAMFETSAEVIKGLAKAFHDYETGEEKVWKNEVK